MALALAIANDVYREHAGRDLVITSLCEGKHKRGSKHYSGCAADLRIWGVKDLDLLVTALKAALGEEFDVILEKDHIHVEWDPEEA